MSKAKLSPTMQRLVEARHGDPFGVLGRHVDKDLVRVRVLLPHAEEEACLTCHGAPSERLKEVAEGRLSRNAQPETRNPKLSFQHLA